MEVIKEEHVKHNHESFDLNSVRDCLLKCNDNELDLAAYIEAYKNLNKLFHKLGGLFTFIARDIHDKVEILSRHVSSKLQQHYVKIHLMLNYEITNHILEDPSFLYTNGSRTLLRLHRSLLFVIRLIDSVRKASDSDKLAPLAKVAYDQTLAVYHPWLIRKGVHLAVHTLPSRKQFIADLAGASITSSEANQLMESTVLIGQTLFDAIDRLYIEKNLHNLP